MNFVYHMVPKNMSGKYLMPLNRLKDLDENLYAQYVSKYDDHLERAFLMDREIPLLDCLWNDAVHFSTLHPHHIYKELEKLDLNLKTNMQFYKIPVENLDGNANAYYHYKKEYYQGPASPIATENIELLNIRDYRELSGVPQDTLEYFKEESGKNNRVGMFHYVPHVLSKGKVPVEDAEVIKWNEPLE